MASTTGRQEDEMELGAALVTPPPHRSLTSEAVPPEVQHSLVVEEHREVRQQRRCCCLNKTRCCFCCCCMLPRWVWWSTCSACFYLIMIPMVGFFGHFIVYPGVPLGEPSLLDGQPCQNVNFTNAAGRNIHALECQAGAAEGPLHPAILFGGNAMNMYDTMFMSKLLPEEKRWDVFSMSMPGFQYGILEDAIPSDDISWTSQQAAMEDIRALLEYVTAQSKQPITVFGWSIGSAMAASLVDMSSGTQAVSCIVLGNPFTSLRREVLARTLWLMLPWLYMFDTWTVQDWVASFQVPTIVLSSTEDEVIPQWMHTAVYNAAPSGRALLIEESAKHMEIPAFKTRLKKALLDWCKDPASG